MSPTTGPTDAACPQCASLVAQLKELVAIAGDLAERIGKLAPMTAELRQRTDAHQEQWLSDELQEAWRALDEPTLDDLRNIVEVGAARLFPWELVELAGLVNEAVERYAPHEVAARGVAR